MCDDIVLIVHGAPGPPLLVHGLLQLGDVLLGLRALGDQLLEHWGGQGLGPGLRKVSGNPSSYRSQRST